MLKVQELKKAVTELPQVEYVEFRQWFLQSDWEKRDREIEEDAKSGKLDFLVREAGEAKKRGTLRDL